MKGATRGWGAVVSGAEIGRQEILHRPKDAWHLVRQGLRQHLLLFPERRLSLFVCLFLYLPLSLSRSVSLAFCIHRPRAVYAVHFQPVNVRSTSRPSTRCTCSEISLFLHCSILDPLSLLLFSVFLPLFVCFSNYLSLHQRLIKHVKRVTRRFS